MSQIFRHENLVVVAPVLLQRFLLNSILYEAQPVIQSPRGFVVTHYRQLNQFDLLPRSINHRLDQATPHATVSRALADVHANQRAFVRFLWSFSNQQPGDPHNFGTFESAQHFGIAQSLQEQYQRPRALRLKRVPKRFWVVSKSLQPDFAVQSSVCGFESAYLKVVASHVTVVTETARQDNR